MKYLLPIIGLLISIYSCELLPTPAGDATAEELVRSFDPIPHQYPRTFRDSSVADDFFGKMVADPYRWLEGDTTQEVARWVDAQQGVTEAYLSAIPYRDKIAERLTQLWSFARFGIPEYHGGYYYLFHNDGQQDQDALYRVASLKDPLELVLDPNTWSADGTRALGSYAFSPDGAYLAYQVSDGGSDWQQIRVLDLMAGKHLEELIRGVKFSNIAWSGSGFYYSKYPGNDRDLSRSNTFHQLYYHRLGTPQAEDELVYADRAHPQRNVYAQTDSAGHWLVLSTTESTSGNALYIRDLRDQDPSFIPMVENFEHDYVYVGKNGDNFLFLTNDEADNWRLIQVNNRQPQRGYWEDIIPQRSEVLQEVKQVGDRLLAKYLRNATSHVVIFDLEGNEIKQLRLPELGTLTGFRKGQNQEEVFFGFTSFTRPETVYRLRLDDYRTALFRQPQTAFDADNYQTKQVWVKSADGTEIPVFLISRKGTQLNTPRPTLLYGYGGFDISIVPRWNLTRLLLVPGVLENDGVVAVANLRGGGEFGAAWHEAGTQLKKQNVFDDFQAVAEYLIAQNITTKDKLGIYGRSNGGLLVGACLTQRPDLYEVAFPAVGVLDMMRYHRFTIGWAWAGDYGTSADSAMADYLLSYSPVHNVEPLAYPATLVTTADHDDRVVPAHSFKFAAELQHQQRGNEPVLIRIDKSAGHGASTPVSKRVAEGADVLSFFFYHLEEQWQPLTGE